MSARGDEPLFTRGFLLLTAAQTFFGMSFSVYFLLPKYLAVEFDAEPATIGAIAGASWFVTVLCAPLTGALVDRWGRKRFLFSGALLNTAGCALFALVDEVGTSMLVARALQGIGFSFFFVGASTLATDWSPVSRLGQALGVLGGTMLATNAIAPALAEPVAGALGWAPVFWATVACSLAPAILVLPVARFDSPRAERDGSGLLRVATTPALLPVFGAVALSGLIFGVLHTFSGPFALDLGSESVSVFFVAYAVTGIVVRLGFGSLGDRLGRLPVVLASMTLYGVAPLLVLGVASYGLVVPGMALGLAHGVFYPLLNAVAVERSELRDRGKVMALYNGAFNVGFVSGSAGLGLLVEAFGYALTFAASALAALPALALLGRMHASERQRAGLADRV